MDAIIRVYTAPVCVCAKIADSEDQTVTAIGPVLL